MKKIYVFLSIFACLLIFSCGNVAKSEIQVDSASGNRIMMKGVAKNSVNYASPIATNSFSDMVMEESVEVQSTYSNGSSKNSSVENVERKLIKRGNLEIEVSNLQSGEEAIEKWCKDFGGYVASSSNYETSAHFSLKIPAQNFDVALNSLGELGKVKSKNISTQDVSEQFYDLQTRLETKKIMRDRLKNYLAQAKDVKDMLQIEKELNNALSEIESMEGRLKRLSGQIEFSSVDISLVLPYRTTDEGFVWPDIPQGFRKLISNIVDFFVGFFKILLYIVIFGVPIICVVAFFYWLLIGKKGLLIKLFKKLSK